MGSPDSGTIPAALRRQLSQSVSPLCVRNLGQKAFVSSQDVLELLRVLQKGEVPDLVIFYNGFNDVYAASLYRQAGVHLNLDGIARRFEDPGADRSPLADMIQRSQTWLLARDISAMMDRSRAEDTRPAIANPPTDSLADAVVAAWLANYRTVTSMAHDWGFEVAFYWQPFLAVGDKRLTPEELQMAEAAAGVVPLGRAVYRRMEALAPELPGLHYFGNVFDADTSLVWIDFVHVTPDANRQIAQRMIAELSLLETASPDQ